MIATLDPGLNKIFSQRDTETVAEFERDHPEFFPVGTTTDQKIEYIKKIRVVQKRAEDQKHETFHKLDGMVETAAIDKAAAKEKNAIDQAAIDVLKTGNPLEFLLDGFRFNHAGHEENARAIIYAYCAQSSGTSKGIQPEVTGSKGSGKSHSISSTLFLMPGRVYLGIQFLP